MADFVLPQNIYFDRQNLTAEYRCNCCRSDITDGRAQHLGSCLRSLGRRTSWTQPSRASAHGTTPTESASTALRCKTISIMSVGRSVGCLERTTPFFVCIFLTFVRRVVGGFLDAGRTLVSNVMTPNPLWVSPTDSAMDALSTMLEKHFRHLPVSFEPGRVTRLSLNLATSSLLRLGARGSYFERRDAAHRCGRV